MREPPNVIQLVQSGQNCKDCDAHSLCIAFGIEPENTHKLSNIIKQSVPYKPGEYIYQRGDSFKSLFAIQSGVVKTETSDYEGSHLVTGFYYSGDLLAIEAIADKTQPFDAIVIKHSRICEIPFAELEEICTEFPNLQHELLKRLSKRIYSHENDTILNRNIMSEKRVLNFFIEFFTNSKSGEYVCNHCIQLPMSKTDLSSYLGLRPETFSRVLRELEDKGYIINAKNHIEIIDLENIYKATL